MHLVFDFLLRHRKLEIIQVYSVTKRTTLVVHHALESKASCDAGTLGKVLKSLLKTTSVEKLLVRKGWGLSG